MEGDRVSQSRQPWTLGRLLAAYETSSLDRSTVGGKFVVGEWLMLSRLHRAAHRGGRELCPSVRGDGGQHSKPGDPAGEQGSSAVGGCDGEERNCLWPSRFSVNHIEQESVAVRGW
jgi:hypothetical protein